MNEFKMVDETSRPHAIPLAEVPYGSFFIREDDGKLTQDNLFYNSMCGVVRLCTGMDWDKDNFDKVYIVYVTEIKGALV